MSNFPAGSSPEPLEVPALRVQPRQFHGRRLEALPPVRPGSKRKERLLDLRQYGEYGVRPALPGEVNADRVLLVGAAEPQTVGGDRADLAGLENRRDPRAEAAQLVECLGCVVTWKEVLALKFLAAAGRELQPEVREC